MQEWKIYRIGDICKRVCSGGTPKSTEPSYYDGEIPWLNTKEINFNRISSTEKHITLSGLENSSAKWIDKNSVIVAMYGATAAKVAINTIPLTTNQACCNLSIDETKADYRFVYYWLCSHYTELASLANGGAQQNLNAQQIKDFEIKLPEIQTQQKIADLLWSIDNKIICNKSINDNLEQQAQALYKSWFVDFEPFKDGKFIESELGLIPEGWSIIKVGELPLYISDYVSNGSFASLKENVTLYETPNYAQFIRNTDLKSQQFSVWVDEASYEFLGKSKLTGGEIIISNVGDVGSVHLCPKLSIPMTLGNNVIMIKPIDIVYNYFIYMTFKWFYGRDLIKGITGGSAMPKFNKTDFKSLKLAIPDYASLSKFNSLVSKLMEQVINLNHSNQRLSQTRDTLLPKLMSGEFKINEIDC